jgi:hypothetical protein
MKIRNIYLLLLLVLFINACTDKLDLLPTNDITSETVFSTPEGYRQALSKPLLTLEILVERALRIYLPKSFLTKVIQIFYVCIGICRS